MADDLDDEMVDELAEKSAALLAYGLVVETVGKWAALLVKEKDVHLDTWRDLL